MLLLDNIVGKLFMGLVEPLPLAQEWAIEYISECHVLARDNLHCAFFYTVYLKKCDIFSGISSLTHRTGP